MMFSLRRLTWDNALQSLGDLPPLEARERDLVIVNEAGLTGIKVLSESLATAF